ncbi:type II toxin-antitoxin system toxin DNA ADP-ribosyl transferase DarT [Polaribacter sp. M15]
MEKPDTVYLYRIMHIDNLDFILKSKTICCPNLKKSDPDFIGIGDNSLIESRKSKQIPIKPKGDFSNYVSFYFGARSPMLYNIQKGYNNVTKRKPEDIIYLVTSFKTVKENKLAFVFTDGHGYHNLSQFFNEEKFLKEVDWKTVNLVRWNDTESDPDRKRKKQAEFLIHKEVPFSMIKGIVTYNENAKTKILTKLAENNINCNVIVKSNYYY